jgi:hypothetical protein
MSSLWGKVKDAYSDATDPIVRNFHADSFFDASRSAYLSAIDDSPVLGVQPSDDLPVPVNNTIRTLKALRNGIGAWGELSKQMLVKVKTKDPITGEEVETEVDPLVGATNNVSKALGGRRASSMSNDAFNDWLRGGQNRLKGRDGRTISQFWMPSGMSLNGKRIRDVLDASPDAVISGKDAIRAASRDLGLSDLKRIPTLGERDPFESDLGIVLGRPSLGHFNPWSGVNGHIEIDSRAIRENAKTLGINDESTIQDLINGVRAHEAGHFVDFAENPSFIANDELMGKLPKGFFPKNQDGYILLNRGNTIRFINKTISKYDGDLFKMPKDVRDVFVELVNNNGGNLVFHDHPFNVLSSDKQKKLSELMREELIQASHPVTGEPLLEGELRSKGHTSIGNFETNYARLAQAIEDLRAGVPVHPDVLEMFPNIHDLAEKRETLELRRAFDARGGNPPPPPYGPHPRTPHPPGTNGWSNRDAIMAAGLGGAGFLLPISSSKEADKMISGGAYQDEPNYTPKDEAGPEDEALNAMDPRTRNALYRFFKQSAEDHFKHQ